MKQNEIIGGERLLVRQKSKDGSFAFIAASENYEYTLKPEPEKIPLRPIDWQSNQVWYLRNKEKPKIFWMITEFDFWGSEAVAGGARFYMKDKQIMENYERSCDMINWLPCFATA